MKLLFFFFFLVLTSFPRSKETKTGIDIERRSKRKLKDVNTGLNYSKRINGGGQKEKCCL